MANDKVANQKVANDKSAERPSFNLILQPEFPINALILATEALRIANQNSGRELFTWRIVSEDGQPVRASSGMWMQADCDFAGMPRATYTLLFEGNLPTQRNSAKLLNQLRTAARFGGSIGGIDTGTFALAQAGLLGERETVLHWEATPTFHERFPETETKNQLYLIDGKRIACAGGVATLDLMLDLIGRTYGAALANEVADALVHTPRPAHAAQRLGDTAGAKKSLSDRIVAVMESHLDFPLDLDGIAGKLGVSSRTVVRECRRSFSETPMRLYLRIRLQAARNILFYEEFSIKDVAVACGFSYPAVFSRAFRAQFKQTPRAFRASFRSRQKAAIRPEIRRLSVEAAR
ncbi:MAG TPA: helix-turn-helix domain-containing protein [Dongiaceae bacterium]|jgi:AraC family carnitine catabolism transcriptional activator|nr:helix-turn-helix domain-containing protein [Dongiaceae bacterium]